mgnify:CR=1 FL=1
MIFKRISDGKVVFFHLVITFNEKATLIYDAKAEVKMKKSVMAYIILSQGQAKCRIAISVYCVHI